MRICINFLLLLSFSCLLNGQTNTLHLPLRLTQEGRVYSLSPGERDSTILFRQGDDSDDLSEITINPQKSVAFTWRKKFKPQRNGTLLTLNFKQDDNLIAIYFSKNGKKWEEFSTVVLGQEERLVLDKTAAFRYLKITSKRPSRYPSALTITRIFITENKEGKQRTPLTSPEIACRSGELILKVKDGKYFDGDRLSISLNGKLIAKRKLLWPWKKSFHLSLEEGENELAFKADTEGLIDNNTVKVILRDRRKVHYGKIILLKNRVKIFVLKRE